MLGLQAINRFLNDKFGRVYSMGELIDSISMIIVLDGIIFGM